ncbi:MAG TPA: protein kinase [Candidatus Eremiobacteraeota bacterium]|nr:protein kinase [Candidatus Eremiobacteraeota bacterium]
MELICAVCGAEYKVEVKFCNECGSQRFVEQELGKLILSPGEIIASRYKIIHFLKAGGMGAVYKVEDINLSKICAIKELINIFTNDSEKKAAITRFEREARILSELYHPNLPRVIDYFVLGNRNYLAMDFIDGEDLASILKVRGKKGFSEKEVIEWSLQICDVLTYLHTRNPKVIYRDLKPSNIMIRHSDQKAMLIDFGIARTIINSLQDSLTKTAIGTLGYIAPEQYRGKPDPRSDIYSLGATMHHLLSGKMPLPFDMESLDNLRPDISSQLNSVIMKALRMKPSARFQSVTEMKKALMGNINIEDPVEEERTKIDLLLNQLNVNDPELRYIVIRSLQNYRDEEKIIDPLINIVSRDTDLIVRREAAKFLATFSDKRILRAFNKVISHSDLEIRQTAIKVLETFKDPSSTEALIYALGDDNSEISFRAAICLLSMKEIKALDEIFKLLERQTSPEMHSKLNDAIKALDTSYIEDWHKEKEKVEIKKLKKKEIKTVIYLIIFILIAVVVTKMYLDTSKGRTLKKLVSEGQTYLEQYDFENALVCFNRAMEIEPDSPEIIYCVGNTYICVDKVKARLYLKKAIDLKKDYPEALMAMGRLYLIENNFKEAINYLEESINLNNKLPMVHIYLGRAYYKSGNKAKAEEIFNLAQSSSDESTYRSAKVWIKKLRGEKSPIKQKIKTLLDRGESLFKQGDYSLSSQAFLEAITLNPDDSRGYSGMGRVHLNRKNYNMSLKYFLEALDCNPLDIESLCNVAYIYIQEDDTREALRSLGMAAEVDSSYSKIHYLRGLLYYKKGEKEKALKELKFYLNIEPFGEYFEEIKRLIKEIEKEYNL